MKPTGIDPSAVYPPPTRSVSISAHTEQPIPAVAAANGERAGQSRPHHARNASGL
jgi:hypothetical protein